MSSLHRWEVDAVDANSPGSAEAIFGGPDDSHPRGIGHATLLGALLTIITSFGSGTQEEHAPVPHA